MKKRILYIPKTMRIFILSVFLCIFLFPNSTFAGACLIENGTAPIITQYTKDLRKVISNLTTEIKKAPSEDQEDTIIGNLKQDFVSTGKDIYKIYNEAVDWDGYFSYFEFYALFPISHEVPYQIMRDHNLIKKEQEGLRKFFNEIISSGLGNIEIKGICNGIGNCNLEGKAKEVVGELLKNNTKVANFYRETVIGDENLNTDTFIITPRNFRLEVIKYYGGDTIEDCSDSEENWFARIKKSFSNIWTNTILAANAFQDWKDAWQMMQGIARGDDFPEEEKRLLREALKTQGISLDSKSTVWNNLEHYNSEKGGFPDNLTYTFTNLKKSVVTQWDSFVDSIKENFEEKETVSIRQIQEVKEREDISNYIEKSIETLYQKQRQLMPRQDVNTAQTRQKIIQMHVNIASSVKILEETKGTSQDVCNSQATGMGKCN